MTDRAKTVSRARLTACRYVGDSAIILVVREKKLYRIEGVGKRICELAESPVNVRELTERITREYAVTPEKAEADVSAFITDLVARKILSTGDAA